MNRHAEMVLMVRAVGDALNLAKAGHVSAGHQILLQGLQWANRVCEANEEWSKELCQRYQAAIDYFDSQFGLGQI
jgi:hypothetical protein